MPRKLRVEYAGAIYHLMSRGDPREAVFLDDVNRQDFLKTLAETCQKSDWRIRIISGLFHGLNPQMTSRLVEVGPIFIPIQKYPPQ